MDLLKYLSLAVFLLSYKVAIVSAVSTTTESNTATPDIQGIPCRNTEKIKGLTSIHYGGFCYWFTKYAKANWDEANSSCQRTSSALASIHSYKELSFIKKALSKAERSSYSYWIGMKFSYGSFLWDDGSPMGFLNWEPQLTLPLDNSIDHCVYMDPTTGYFGFSSCKEKKFFICKTDDPVVLTSSVSISSTTIALPPVVCPDDWQFIDDTKCFAVFGLEESDKQTWKNADNECIEKGATLLSIHSQREQDAVFLSVTALGKTNRAWIGFHETKSSADRAFHWSDGSPVSFTDWDRNQPNNWDGKEEECVDMRFDDPHYGKWNDAECEVLTQSYICQIYQDPKKAKFAQVSKLCVEPKGWMKLKSTCYNIFNGSDNTVSWQQAERLCNTFGGNLITVKGIRETTFLRYHLHGLQDLYWIGMKNEATFLRYSWITGPAEYSNWARDEPKETSGNKPNCVVTDSNGRWKVKDCQENHPFICEVVEDDVNPFTPTPNQTGLEMMCPVGSQKWKDYGGRFCYIIEIKEQVTWYEAVQRCFHVDGFLASFHSLDEVNIILKKITNYRSNFHIGLGRKQDGGFRWIDTSAVDFVNWGETGHTTLGPQMCVEMQSSSGKWNDVSCDNKRGYICSVPKISGRVSARKGDEAGIGVGAIMAIIIGIIAVITLSVGIYCYFFPSMKNINRFTELRNV